MYIYNNRYFYKWYVIGYLVLESGGVELAKAFLRIVHNLHVKGLTNLLAQITYNL